MASNHKNIEKALKILFTDYLHSYNAFNLKEHLAMSDVGSLKLLRRLKQQNIVTSKNMGNAIFYRPNLERMYVLKLLELIFLDHSYLSNYVKGWIEELKVFIPKTKALLLYGSILTKDKKAADVDVCFILKDAEDYQEIQKEVNKINIRNRLKIHSLYLTPQEFEKKLIGQDAVTLNLIKTCIVIHGVELFVKTIAKVQKR